MTTHLSLISRGNLFSLSFIALLLVSLFARAAEFPVAENGLLDARALNLNEIRLPLNGFWIYYPNQLLFPGERQSARGVPVDFPRLWSETVNSKDSVEYATYFLTVVTSAGHPPLALEIPQVYSSYRVWVNGSPVGVNGRVGRVKEETIPQWLPQTLSLSGIGDTLQIVLQIANFNHYKGGIKEPIYLGSNELLQRHRTLSEVSSKIEISALFLLSLFFIWIYFLKERKKIVLYFALLCLTWSVRSAFSNLYVFIVFVPQFNWDSMVRIEYITLYFTMIWAILFLGRIFEREGNPIVKYLFVTGNILFTVFTLLTSPAVFTRWLPIYLGFAVILLLYGVFVILWALINERVGARTLLTTISLGIAVFSYDILAYKDFFSYNPIVFNAGYIIIFLLVSVALLLHLNIIPSKPKPSGILRYDDLYKKER